MKEFIEVYNKAIEFNKKYGVKHIAIGLYYNRKGEITEILEYLKKEHSEDLKFHPWDNCFYHIDGILNIRLLPISDLSRGTRNSVALYPSGSDVYLVNSIIEPTIIYHMYSEDGLLEDIFANHDDWKSLVEY